MTIWNLVEQLFTSSKNQLISFVKDTGCNVDGLNGVCACISVCEIVLSLAHVYLVPSSYIFHNGYSHLVTFLYSAYPLLGIVFFICPIMYLWASNYRNTNDLMQELFRHEREELDRRKVIGLDVGNEHIIFCGEWLFARGGFVLVTLAYLSQVIPGTVNKSFSFYTWYHRIGIVFIWEFVAAYFLYFTILLVRSFFTRNEFFYRSELTPEEFKLFPVLDQRGKYYIVLVQGLCNDNKYRVYKRQSITTGRDRAEERFISNAIECFEHYADCERYLNNILHEEKRD